jgi:putative hydrolase of the HAD superfamily
MRLFPQEECSAEDPFFDTFEGWARKKLVTNCRQQNWTKERVMRVIHSADAVFFDAVGTLIHPDPPAPDVYWTVGQRFGSRLDLATITARFRMAFHRQEEADRAGGLRTNEEREVARWRTIVGEVLDHVTDSEACFHELFAHFSRPDAWRCVPETAEVLDTLAGRGHVLGLASNFDRRLRKIAEELPALRSIRHLVISSEIGWRKPAAGFYAEMCRQAGRPPEQVLYVGDDLINDYEGARSAGLRAVLLDPHRRAAIPSEGCITALSDLLPILFGDA